MNTLTMTHSSNLRLIASIKAASRIASAIVFLVGCVVLLGWKFDVTLPGFFPPLVTMSANAALCFILAGVSLWMLRIERTHQRMRLLAQAFAMVVSLTGLLTFMQYSFGLDLGIDRLLFKEPLRSGETFSQYRMAPSTAVSFFLAGLALFFLDVESRRGLRPAEFLALGTIAISLLAVVGFILDAPLYGIDFYYQMAMYSTAALIILGCGVLFVHPDRGMMATITSNSDGGFLARRFLPVALGIPLVLSWLRLTGERAGFYNIEMGRLLFVASSMIAFTIVTWRNAALLNRMDIKRHLAEEVLRSKQKELEETNERLKEVDRLKTEFVNILNHELRTPLASIQGGIDLVLDNSAASLTPDQVSFLRTAKNNADRLRRLINNLLDISKIEAGHMEFRFAPFEPSLLIEEGISNNHPKAREKGIHLVSSTISEISQVKIDHDRILEVLDNLISNAIKFTPPDGEVRIMVRQWGKAFACIEIADSGIGIKKEDQDRLFEKFYQITNGKEGKSEGTGLGLAICKSIVEAHGGKIWVESAYQKGSRFYFTVPLVEQKPAMPK